jgi:hypothetical protein
MREDVRIRPGLSSLVDQTELLVNVLKCRSHFRC